MKNYILECAESANIGYTSTFTVFKNKQNAEIEAKRKFVKKLLEYEYSEDEIKEILNDSDWVGVDLDGSLLLNDPEESEFYFKVFEADVAEDESLYLEDDTLEYAFLENFER